MAMRDGRLCYMEDGGVVDFRDVARRRARDRPALWTAAAPFGFHALNEEPLDVDTQTLLPRFYPS